MSMEKLVMMVPTLLNPSGIAVEFGQVQATREAFDLLGRASGYGTVPGRGQDENR
jgi:hypothetical protein